MLGLDNKIILKQVWEVTIQPGWEIRVVMWPTPELPPEEALADKVAEVIVPAGPPPPPSGEGACLAPDGVAGTLS